MFEYKILFFLAVMALLWLSFAYFDTKYNFQLIRWMNGEVSSPFAPETLQYKESINSKSQRVEELQEEVSYLKDRVQILEKIVTEPSYELNQELNKLSKN